MVYLYWQTQIMIKISISLYKSYLIYSLLMGVQLRCENKGNIFTIKLYTYDFQYLIKFINNISYK